MSLLPCLKIKTAHPKSPFEFYDDKAGLVVVAQQRSLLKQRLTRSHFGVFSTEKAN